MEIQRFEPKGPGSRRHTFKNPNTQNSYFVLQFKYLAFQRAFTSWVFSNHL